MKADRSANQRDELASACAAVQPAKDPLSPCRLNDKNIWKRKEGDESRFVLMVKGAYFSASVYFPTRRRDKTVKLAKTQVFRSEVKERFTFEDVLAD